MLAADLRAAGGVEGVILKAKPAILTFTSLNGGRKVMGPKAVAGEQKERLGATRVFILPSPSPLAANHRDVKPWRDLAKVVKKPGLNVCTLMRHGFAALLALLCGCSAAFAGEQPYRIASYGGLFTDVTINGQGPFSFLIDTGASNSLIYEHTRKALGLTQSQPGRLVVYGVNDVATAMPVRPGELRVAGEAVRDLTMGVLPDGRADLGDGVLGLDVLERYFVVLDRQAMRLRLLTPGPSATQPYRDWTDAVLTARPLKTSPARFWYLSMYFDRGRFPTLFDLGAAATMINWKAASELGVRQRDYIHFGPPPENLQDLLGKTAPALRLMNIQLGVPGRKWERREVLIADAPAFGYFGLDDQPAAVVGPGLLRDVSLAIDFAAGKLYLGPSAEP